MSVSRRVKDKVKRLRRGQPVPIERFHGLGPAGAVRKALSRLVKSGELVNVARGLYARPEPNEFFGTQLPAEDEVARAIARARGERIATHGAWAANWLGLSSQIPVAPVFYTTGRTRSVRFGATEIQFEHAPGKIIAAAETPAGPALLALHHFGTAHVTPELLERLNERYPVAELLQVEATPVWLRRRIERWLKSRRA